jgi:hypothetical protein
VGEINGSNPAITHNGAEVLECLCGHNIWWIESCLPKLNTYCSTLQKNIKHSCKAKIISKQTNRGIPTLCYVGYWVVAKSVSIELHKFWFSHYDFMCCVGGTSRKLYALKANLTFLMACVSKG